MTAKTICLFFIFVLLTGTAISQTEVDERAVINFDKGLGFLAPDSAFGFNIRFRMQNRIGMTTVSARELTPEEFEANVRRLRLRFDGFVGKSGLTYYLQLSFSRSDQDWDASGVPGIVRDAMVFYSFSDHFYIGMGQGKLPGNRQRVISSGQQQFADRSLVNAIFNIDRDFGIMGYYSNQLSGFRYNLKGAVSTGEGRNILRSDNGLAYTARIELLPLGPFSNDGDFSEGDLMREPSPKLSVGGTYSINKQAQRASGQRGPSLTHPTDIENFFLDAIAKYQGWALQTEFAKRMADRKYGWNMCGLQMTQPFDEPVYTGYGINTQLSYVFQNYFELAGRYTYVKPDVITGLLEPETRIITLGLTKYIPSHRNKLQLNVSHLSFDAKDSERKNRWNVMLQVELGI